MHLMDMSVILADSPPAQQQNPLEGLRMFVPLTIVMIGFFIVSSRMQKKKAQEHEQRIKSLKPGDKITTSSGILATVITVKDDSVTIRSADAKMEITKGAIGEIRERSSESSASSS